MRNLYGQLIESTGRVSHGTQFCSSFVLLLNYSKEACNTVVNKLTLDKLPSNISPLQNNLCWSFSNLKLKTVLMTQEPEFCSFFVTIDEFQHYHKIYLKVDY